MNIGDLVKINDLNEPDPKRTMGTIIRHDMYDSQFSKINEQISEVLWNNGQLGWILSKRLEIVSGFHKIGYG
tara:strand:+ start:6 stop:221 length:216 start_codon:yes stop_codon:yes gene_type:complete